jgi:hypothetical protein
VGLNRQRGFLSGNLRAYDRVGYQAGVPCSCCWCRQRRSSFALRPCLEEVELSIKTTPSQNDSHELAWSYSCDEGRVE